MTATHTTTSHHHWNASLPIVKSEIILPDSMHELHDQHTEEAQTLDGTHTTRTLRSRSSSLRTSLLSRGGGSFRSNSNHVSSCPREHPSIEAYNNYRGVTNNKKSLGCLFTRMKLRTKQWSRLRRKNTISETNLRKKLKKSAERGDWNDVRKLLSNYDFADIPTIIPEPLIHGCCGDSSSHEGKSSNQSCGTGGCAGRRPSYGSRNSITRNSFTGKESAAAAAAIKAAQFVEFDEGESSAAALSSERLLNAGENVLHDICRCNPPLDVLERLLTSLRHRRGYTSGKDDMGRTPLHVAAASCGASPDVIDALARADPSPASIEDVDGRTPLHIAVRYLAYNRREENHPPEEMEQLLAIPPPSPRQEEPLDEKACEQFATTISILKEVMMAYPGKVDFKDEDKLGYSPLDYAIDGNITDEIVLHCLLRRKGLITSKRRSTAASNDTQVTQNLYKPLKRSQLQCDTSSTCSQDIEVLLRLEEEEIADRRKKVEKMRSRQQKVTIQNTLFDMFGIDQEPGEEITPCVEQEKKKLAEKKEEKEHDSPKQQQQPAGKSSDSHDLQRRPKRRTSKRMLSFRSNLTSSSSKKLLRRESDAVQPSIGSEDIYNAHLDAYLDGLVDDNLEFRNDDDSFDIFHDPEEDCVLEEETELDVSTQEGGRPPIIEIDIQLNLMNDILSDDDMSQCSRFGRSVVSEISVPAILVNRET
mmetsp:Transcript_26324/g.44810  ORF Transcript_26324/g.44810 Transcript_26324/m.44810 type:complete len:702 (-) Transcript_26324:37-2142(-)